MQYIYIYIYNMKYIYIYNASKEYKLYDKYNRNLN